MMRPPLFVAPDSFVVNALARMDMRKVMVMLTYRRQS